MIIPRCLYDSRAGAGRGRRDYQTSRQKGGIHVYMYYMRQREERNIRSIRIMIRSDTEAAMISDDPFNDAPPYTGSIIDSGISS